MVVNWKGPDGKDDLLAGWVASLGSSSIPYKEIARYIGKGATYYAVEGQFRGIRKRAAEMKAAVENGTERPASTTVTPTAARRTGGAAANGASGSGRKRASAKKDGVLTGRVEKADPATPTRKPKEGLKREGSTVKVKEEGGASESLGSGSGTGSGTEQSFYDDFAAELSGPVEHQHFSFDTVGVEGDQFAIYAGEEV